MAPNQTPIPRAWAWQDLFSHKKLAPHISRLIVCSLYVLLGGIQMCEMTEQIFAGGLGGLLSKAGY